MGMDVYTPSYWAARESGEYTQAEELYQQFISQENLGDGQEDWGLYQESQRLSAELDLKYGHFRWGRVQWELTGEGPGDEGRDFTAIDARRWAGMAQRAWDALPHGTLLNGFGEVMAEGAILSREHNILLTEWDLKKFKALADLGECFYIT